MSNLDDLCILERLLTRSLERSKLSLKIVTTLADHLAEIKTDLKGIYGELLLLGLEEKDELFNKHTVLTKKIF